MKYVAALLFACALLLGTFAVPVRAEEAGQENIVQDWAQLKNWLSSHTEGTVYLADTVVLTSSFQLQHPVTIDTGEYGLVLNGGVLSPTGDGENAAITGEGTQVPVVEVKSMGTLWVGSWTNYLSLLRITATGDGVRGGTALRIASSGEGVMEGALINFNIPGQIRAFGPDAVGLELMADFTAFAFDITVEGPGSTAVRTHAGASICFSSLSASGEGAEAVAGEGNILLDCCQVQPAPRHENVQVYQGELMTGYYPVQQGSDAVDLQRALGPNLRFGVALRGNSPASHGFSLYPVWDAGQVAGIDTTVLGRTLVEGTVSAPWLAGRVPAAPQLVVEVRDSQTPCINEVFIGNDMVDGKRETLYGFEMWEADDWTVEDCILQISRDGGRNWLDFTEDAAVTWTGSGFRVWKSAISEGMMFKVEVPGYGTSNMVRLSQKEGLVPLGSGGDRTGADRLGVDLDAEEEEDAEPPKKPGNIPVTVTPGEDPVVQEQAGQEAIEGILPQDVETPPVLMAATLPAQEASPQEEALVPAKAKAEETVQQQPPAKVADVPQVDPVPTTAQPALAQPGGGVQVAVWVSGFAAAGALAGFLLLRRRTAQR